MEQCHNRVRALSPLPGAWCLLDINGKCKRIKILRSRIAGKQDNAHAPGSIIITELGKRLLIACAGGGILEILELQPEAKRAMTAEAFLRGYNQLMK